MCERLSILLIITDPESPWQAGRVERHGGWIKELAEAEVASRQLILKDASELNAFLCELTAAKNAHFNRGGYTPMQLVYGRNPQVPGELLGQGEISQLASTTTYPQDGPAEQEHFRAQQIRHRAREMAFTHQCRTKFNVAVRSNAHQDKLYSLGQWVFVWRKHQAANRAHMQHRSGSWRGPGLVILQQGHTIYVSMKSRLWRCNVDQIRNAESAEMLGAELVQRGQLRDLLLHLHSARGATAVDCTGFGSPTQEEESDAVQLDEAAASIVPIGSNTQLPPQISAEYPPLIPLPSLPENQEVAHELVQGPNTEPLRQVSTSNTLQEPEPMDDLSSNRTHRSESEDRLEVSKMARTQNREHASSAAASASAAGQTTSSSSQEPRPWLRLTTAERQAALRDLERLPECLRTSESDQPEVDQQNEGSETLMSDLGMSLMGSSESHQGSGITRERAKALGEVRLEDLSDELRESFKESDMQEWDGRKQVVKVHLGTAARALREQWPDRIITGRMVRRLKAQPGVGSDPKPKSRFCCHGHKDPDTGRMRIFAPTPPVESLMMFMTTTLSLGFTFSVMDVKQAFLQSDPMHRDRGPILVTPCPGIPLPQDALMELQVAIYGLDDAPFQWRQTLVRFLRGLNMKRSLLDACWWIKRDGSGRPTQMALLDVDDLILAAPREALPAFQQAVQARFKIGKLEQEESEFCGRHIKSVHAHDGEPDMILIDMEKYIEEKVQEIPMSRTRKAQKNEPLTQSEFEELRSLVFKFAWLSRETRPELCGASSLMASRLRTATVQDIIDGNHLVSYLKVTSRRALRLHAIPTESMHFITFSDAGGTLGKESGLLDESGQAQDTTQGAWLIFAA
eukprot:5141971-Amphidinium_carterae.1